MPDADEEEEAEAEEAQIEESRVLIVCVLIFVVSQHCSLLTYVYVNKQYCSSCSRDFQYIYRIFIYACMYI